MSLQECSCTKINGVILFRHHANVTQMPVQLLSYPKPVQAMPYQHSPPSTLVQPLPAMPATSMETPTQPVIHRAVSWHWCTINVMLAQCLCDCCDEPIITSVQPQCWQPEKHWQGASGRGHSITRLWFCYSSRMCFIGTIFSPIAWSLLRIFRNGDPWQRRVQWTTVIMCCF